MDSKNPDRGPLLITEASYMIQSRNPGVTEIERTKGRGHLLVIDQGWQDVAETALAFVRRFV